MLFQRIKYFNAVVEHGSFTGAARSCAVSQSAVSQQVAALETTLGVKLIERAGRGFKLTSAGKYFYEQSKPLIRKIEGLCEDIAHLEDR